VHARLQLVALGHDGRQRRGHAVQLRLGAARRLVARRARQREHVRRARPGAAAAG